MKLFSNFKMLSSNSHHSLTCNMIELESDEGQKMLLASPFQNNHELLSNSFEQQIWFSYCGIASATMILNALRSDTKYVQLGFSNNRRKQVALPSKSLFGMTLKQLEELFEAYSLSTQIFYANDLCSDRFRDLAVQALERPNSFVVVNYSRRALGQIGWGHFSPLSAYNSIEDRFLVIDVAKKQKYSSAWIDRKALYSAMYTKDLSSRKFRGFIIVTFSV